MRVPANARRSRAIWSRRCVGSFWRARRALRWAIQRSADTTGWFAVFVSVVAVFMRYSCEMVAQGCSGPGAFRAPHGADLSAPPAAAIEELSPIGFEPADGGARGHPQAFEHGAARRIDPADLALVAFPGSVP